MYRRRRRAEHGRAGPRRRSALDVAERLAALDEVIAAGPAGWPTSSWPRPAELARRAGERLRLSGSHTVVALAGATGSGKSSLFNALAGGRLSAVGVRRPTTGVAHA